MLLKKKNSLDNNRFRIIKISKEALFEFIYESVIDNQEEFFDIKDGTKIVSHHDINFDTNEYICIINNDTSESLVLPNGINLKELIPKIPDTTKSMFLANRYIELSLEQLKDIQSKK